MTEEQIKETSDRIAEIWDEMDEVIAGTGVADLIEELVDLEIELEKESNK